MNQKALFFEPKKCIGCRLCEQICTMTHFGITNSKKALIQIIRYHNEQIDRAIFCHSCKDAPCIEACSFDVLSKNPNTNAIEVNKENCVACENCIEQCPYSTPYLHPEEKYILICDLCNGNPECVNICPETAILYLETWS